MNKEAEDQLMETLLWSSDLDDYNITDIDESQRNRISGLFMQFVTLNEETLSEETQDLSQIAHDFILTVNGDGAGFWDGDYNNGDKLTKECEGIGPFEPYVTDDNKIDIVIN
jgi:hypothetical protein